MRGKFLAIERYDTMLWKIRSGYVVVLYGALTILGGTSGLIAIKGADRHRMLVTGILLVFGFSLCGWVVDYFFLRAKFRVVEDANKLGDLALRIATTDDTDVVLAEYDELQDLLRNSGESLKKVPRALLLDAMRPALAIYSSSPLLGIGVLVVLIYGAQSLISVAAIIAAIIILLPAVLLTVDLWQTAQGRGQKSEQHASSDRHRTSRGREGSEPPNP